MKYIYLLTLSLISFLDVNAQNVISKKNLKKLLRIDSGSDTKIWTICNSGKNDTIELYSTMNYFYQSHICCDFVEWEFYRDNRIIEKFTNVCEEPSRGKIITEKDYYSIKIEEENKKTYLSKFYRKKLVIRFRVLEIIEMTLPKEENIGYKVIKLVKE